ncbi:sterol desaturase family [Coccidioides immitis RS]|uniref:Sterol desaturase family n=4 Tax=Coccidioides immitis TaxID=5501 RepID=A0A0E1RW62_COCIM|nr:sterol desaturase family [Coccidioides immitis RS]KMP04123.1 sterol desaturase family protein [Coccidioides immitis RMSCC 2394]KMU72969.1 sterol desaturase family protein [Coccidioides immitis RMSCC 3703]KMU91692.1 sterol desaturase family protein [Coccidioides immitis H538.4]TPX24260.1 hypothetical protein DIZ76_013606 [Coccidioides immitis]EAS31485.1 sterol desaturase family [Coccidioides immitis RS]
MGALFSIPMLSFLLVPAMSSYGTSLNLLFFYITWTTLVLSHSPLKVEIVGTIAVRLLFYLIPSLIFFLFDVLVPSAAVILKAHGSHGLPSGKKRKSGKKEAKVAACAVFNLLLGLLVQASIEVCLTKGLKMKSAIKVSTRLPLPWEILTDLLRGLFGRELLEYIIHRYILHSSTLRVAKNHDTWYHALHTPYPLTAHYDHPIPYLLLRFLPMFLPAAIFRFHLLSFILYLSLISLEETFAYSGYKAMPTSFFIGGIAKRVEMHLTNSGNGNYSPWGIMDWIFGSSIGDSVADDSLEDTEEFDVDELAEKLMERSRKRRRGLKRQSRKRTDS